jgi:beta-alanine degradation protein BauB
MKTYKALSIVAVLLSSAGSALAQDPVKVDPTHYTVVFENASVRVLRIDYAPGSKSTMHQHPDSIVIPFATSKVRFATPDGKSTEQELANEAALYTPAGTHSPSNIGTGRVDALLVEFKSAAPGKAALPASRTGMAMKMLAEGPRAIAYRTTADPTFHEPAGTTHDFDQVVIALGSAQMALAVDGKPAKTTWARGDAVFVGRGVRHEAKNAGSKPVDFIVVAIK